MGKKKKQTTFITVDELIVMNSRKTGRFLRLFKAGDGVQP
jgi:hypothetical protein